MTNQVLIDLEKLFDDWTDRLHKTIPNKNNLREGEKAFIEGQIKILDDIKKLIDIHNSENIKQ